MTKKHFQKRQPSVPAPDVRFPLVPAPRTSHEPVEPEPVEPEATAPDPAGPHPAGPDRPSAVAVAPVSLASPAVQHGPGWVPRTPPSPRPEPRSRSSEPVVGAVLGLLGLLGLLVAGLVVVMVTDEPDDPATGLDRGIVASAAPRILASNETYVETQVLTNGDVVVEQWIRPDAPLTRLRLALPRIPGVANLSASEVVLLADGAVIAGPATMTGVGSGATYVFDETTDVQLRYVLTGAVQRSEVPQGRALALATTLDVRYSPQAERETRVVRAHEVLSLACSASPAASPVPCGQADRLDRWQVELVGPRVSDRVVAQVNLG